MDTSSTCHHLTLMKTAFNSVCMSAASCVNRQPFCPLDQEAISQDRVSQLLLCIQLNEGTLKSLLK